MPRGRIKEILYTSRIDSSPGTRKCHGNKKEHRIKKGTTFLAIKSGLEEKSYCLKCARVILERGEQKMQSLMELLEEAENAKQ